MLWPMMQGPCEEHAFPALTFEGLSPVPHANAGPPWPLRQQAAAGEQQHQQLQQLPARAAGANGPSGASDGDGQTVRTGPGPSWVWLVASSSVRAGQRLCS